MALPTFNQDVEIISQLSDYPNDDDGLEPNELKARFDLGSVLIKEYINEIFIPALEAAIDAAARGITFEGVSGTMLQDGSVYSTALSSEEGNEAVAEANIRNGAVTLDKLSAALQTLLSTVDTRASSAYNRVNGLAAVASSGAYSDLTGTPTVDTGLSADSTNAVQNKVIKAETDAIRTLVGQKQNALTFATAIENNNSIPYNSAVYAAVQTLTNALNNKAAAFNWDATPISGSNNAVRSNGIYQALANKQDKLTIDSALSQTSTNPLQNKAIYSALQAKQNTLSFDTAPTSGSTKPVTSGGVYTALAAKQAAKITRQVTLASGQKTWSVTCSGATASNTIICRPDSTSDAYHNQWVDHNVRCNAQGNGTLSFKADSNTTGSIVVNVLILN